MGVRHAREYRDILQELTDAISNIEDCYLFFEMDVEAWNELQGEEKHEVLEALADDVFYGLGEHPEIEVGSGQVIYNSKLHHIVVKTNDQVYHTVRLI
ncbi:hypothetical protein [Paenibacillus sp. FSL W7-1287]|uniref:hypothetical protein n=1 Tax=Paenibacillus sp. FSL W7-1287 TaxID=2954538 RepID=UPI0030F94F4B